MSQLQKLVLRDFRGGMNTYSSDELFRDNECSELINMRVNERFGALDAHGGSIYNKHNGSSAFEANRYYKSIFRLNKSDGTSMNVLNLEVAGTNYYVADNDATIKTSSAINGEITDYFIHNNQVFFLTSTNTVYKHNGEIDGSFAVTSHTLPASYLAKFGEVYNTRGYYAGDPSYPNTVFASEPDTPEIFESPFVDHIYQINGDGGDQITALKQFGGSLIAFRKRSIFILEGSPPRRIYQFPSDNIGCIDNKTIQRTELGLIFLSNNGVYLFNGSSLKPLSVAIRNDIERVARYTAGRFSSVYHRNRYYLFYQPTGATEIKEGYSFDLTELQYGSTEIPISKMENLKLRDSISYLDVNQKSQWVGVHDNSNVLVKCGIDGYRKFYDGAIGVTSPINTSPSIKTKWLDFGDRTSVVELRYIFIGVFRPLSTVNVNVIKDYKYAVSEESFSETFENDGALWDVAVWDVDYWDSTYGFFTYKITLPSGVYCNRAKFVISCDDGSDLNIDRFEVQYRHLRDVQ